MSVLRVHIKTGSAKIRTGPPSPTPDEPADNTNDSGDDLENQNRRHREVWKGVLPVYQTIDAPIATQDRKEMPVPRHITDFCQRFNDASKAYAMGTAMKVMGTKKKHRHNEDD